MRHLFKNTISGLIIASFIYAPEAFSKPPTAKMTQVKKSSKPLYAGLLQTIRKSKKGVKVSDFTEAAKPMIKNREYKDVRRMMYPFWDKKFDEVVVGSDYFKLSYKGHTVFARYVDRGPVAFIVNNQPVLWKDILIYGRAKKRLTEILRGGSEEKTSWIDSLRNYILPKAFARGMKEDTENFCTNNKLPLVDRNGRQTCLCPEGSGRVGLYADEDEDGEPREADCGALVAPVVVPGGGGTVVTPAPTEKKGGGLLPLLLIGGAMLLFLLLMKRKKKKPVTPPVTPPTTPTPEPPTPDWDPEPEGQCPTPGARGLTAADLPASCRKSSCQATNSCSGSSRSTQ